MVLHCNTRDNHWLLKDPHSSLMETKSSQGVQCPGQDAPDEVGVANRQLPATPRKFVALENQD